MCKLDNTLHIFDEKVLKEACHFRVYDEHGEFLVGRESLFDTLLMALKYTKDNNSEVNPKFIVVALGRSKDKNNHQFTQLSVSYITLSVIPDKWEPPKEILECNLRI